MKAQKSIFMNVILFFMILRQIIGPKRDENGEKRRLHSEECPSLYCSPNIIRMIKSKD
jgi:hypothetical protein